MYVKPPAASFREEFSPKLQHILASSTFHAVCLLREMLSVFCAEPSLAADMATRLRHLIQLEELLSLQCQNVATTPTARQQRMRMGLRPASALRCSPSVCLALLSVFTVFADGPSFLHSSRSAARAECARGRGGREARGGAASQGRGEQQAIGGEQEKKIVGQETGGDQVRGKKRNQQRTCRTDSIFFLVRV